MVKFNPKINNEAALASEILSKGGVVAFPTETVMGLGVSFNDRKAYDKLNKVKERPEDKPYTLMVKNVEEISKYAIIDEATQRVINAFMPGSITILVRVKKGSVPAYVTHNTDVIGIRVPTNIEARILLDMALEPLLVPSANKSGSKPALNSDEVKQIFGQEIDFVMTGKAKGEVPSTIVDLTKETPKVVRPGPIPEEEIIKVWNS